MGYHLTRRSCVHSQCFATLLHFKVCWRPCTHCLLHHLTSGDAVLCSLPTYQLEVLCLHLSSQHLVNGGSEAVMAKCLHNDIRQSSPLPKVHRTSQLQLSLLHPVLLPWWPSQRIHLLHCHLHSKLNFHHLWLKLFNMLRTSTTTPPLPTQPMKLPVIFPPALQVQLLFLIAQFLQYTAPPIATCKMYDQSTACQLLHSLMPPASHHYRASFWYQPNYCYPVSRYNRANHRYWLLLQQPWSQSLEATCLLYNLQLLMPHSYHPW